MASEKSVHTIILDAGPIIRGEPSISTLLQQCEQIVSTPAVISEIRDEATRSRLSTAFLPFLVLRNPKPDSVKLITDFSRKTGDLAVLSRVDIQLLALSYEIECEKNGGDWRLRKTPGQKGTNGPPPRPEKASEGQVELVSGEEKSDNDGPRSKISEDLVHTSPKVESNPDPVSESESESTSLQPEDVHSTTSSTLPPSSTEQSARTWSSIAVEKSSSNPTYHRTEASSNPELETNQPEQQKDALEKLSEQLQDAQVSDPNEEDNASDDSDSEGWITPSNLKKQLAKDAAPAAGSTAEPRHIQVATITGDFAMQNILLQMNLNLLSPALHRVRHIKTFILRCHACFNVVRDMTKQFCPRCGKPTLTRVSCSTNQNGEFTMHLKKNMQWNKRGDRYSIPKPIAGASNGRLRGGGKDNWGSGLILAEDQKEFTRAVTEEKRQKYRDLMDEDYLPAILSGERARSGGKPKVGAGRNVNSRKR